MITFRPIEKDDLCLLKKWRNSEFVRPYVREYRLLNDSDQESWYESYLKSRRKSDWDQELYIIESTGSYLIPDPDMPGYKMPGVDLSYTGSDQVQIPIGVCGFTRIEWRNKRAELSFYLADESYNDESLIKECLNRVIRKGFEEFNFHKITWPVYGHDPRLEIYKTLFEVEAILKQEYWWDGKWQDRYYLSKINEKD